MGMDTISSGVTIAWAMEAFERGDLTEADTDGVKLLWGDMETVINIVLPKMAKREGKLGALLAEGSVAAAEKNRQGFPQLHNPEQGARGADA